MIDRMPFRLRLDIPHSSDVDQLRQAIPDVDSVDSGIALMTLRELRFVGHWEEVYLEDSSADRMKMPAGDLHSPSLAPDHSTPP